MAQIFDFARHHALKADAKTRADELPPEVGPTVGDDDRISRMHSPSLLKLPFVRLPEQLPETWGELWGCARMWCDKETDTPHVDHKRGERYAREAVVAIAADGSTSRTLEMVVEEILRQAFIRRGPGGRLRRRLTSCESAFVNELVRLAVRGEFFRKALDAEAED